MIEGNDTHVRRQRHLGFARNLGHPVEPGCGIFEIFDDAVELGGYPDGCVDSPGGVGIQPQRQLRERLPERLDSGDLLVGRKDAALDLDCPEAVLVDHLSGLTNQSVRIDRLAPFVGLLAGMSCPLVEQIRTERNGVPNLAAEQVGHRSTQDLALHVQARDLEGGEHPIGGAGCGDHACDAVAACDRQGSQDGIDGISDLVEREHVQTEDGGGGRFQSSQMSSVGVRFTESDDTGVGVQLNDRAERIRLMHADGVEQRRIDEGDRCDSSPGDQYRFLHQCTASSSANTARPAATIAVSSSRCGALMSTRGGRTGPASMPSIVTPALMRETA